MEIRIWGRTSWDKVLEFGHHISIHFRFAKLFAHSLYAPTQTQYKQYNLTESSNSLVVNLSETVFGARS